MLGLVARVVLVTVILAARAGWPCAPLESPVALVFPTGTVAANARFASKRETALVELWRVEGTVRVVQIPLTTTTDTLSGVPLFAPEAPLGSGSYAWFTNDRENEPDVPAPPSDGPTLRAPYRVDAFASDGPIDATPPTTTLDSAEHAWIEVAGPMCGPPTQQSVVKLHLTRSEAAWVEVQDEAGETLATGFGTPLTMDLPRSRSASLESRGPCRSEASMAPATKASRRFRSTSRARR